MIDDIPLEIFRIIQQYLNHYEYRQLLNTNSTIFQGGGEAHNMLRDLQTYNTKPFQSICDCIYI